MSLIGSADSSRILRGKLSGLKAIHGYSAYEVAVVNGFDGTVEEWLATLAGQPGISPAVDVYEVDGGHYIYITTADGRETVFVSDGKDANVYVATVGRSYARRIAESLTDGNLVCAKWADNRLMWMKEAKLRSDGRLDYAVFSDALGEVKAVEGSTWTYEGIETDPAMGQFNMTSLEELDGDYSVSFDFRLTGVSTDYNKGDGNGDPNRDEGIHIKPMYECTNPSIPLSSGRAYHYVVRVSEQTGVQLVWTCNVYGDYGTVLAGKLHDGSNVGSHTLPGSLKRDKAYTLKLEKAGSKLKVKVWEKGAQEPGWQLEYEGDYISNIGYKWKFWLGNQNKGSDSESAVISNMVFRNTYGTSFWDGVSENEITARQFFRIDGGSWGPYVPYTESESGGTDGVSPTVTVEAIEGGHRVTITDVNGTQYFDVMDGKNGSGSSGGTGGGADGISPTVAVEEITGGHRVSITDATGTKTFDVMDGVSPSVSVGSLDGGRHRVGITDASGTKIFDVMDGEDGVGVASVEQTTTSTEDGGTNVVTITMTNGQMVTFNVLNGTKGNKGDTGRGISTIIYSSSSNKWIFTYTDGTSTSISGPDISGLMPKSGGTFTGAVYGVSGADTTAQLRNTSLVSADTNPTVNGQINWTYG